MAALLAVLLVWLLPVSSRADDPITELMSPIVSYQYPEDLSSMALTNGGLLSPIVSYVFCEWPGDAVLGLISSPQVSYLYPGYDGPPATISIFAHPQDVQAPARARVQLAVGAVGTPPLPYQWLRDGAVIPGATEAVYVIASAAAAHNGRYAVRVSDASGGPAALSRWAQLAVAAPGGGGAAAGPHAAVATAGHTARRPATRAGDAWLAERENAARRGSGVDDRFADRAGGTSGPVRLGGAANRVAERGHG